MEIKQNTATGRSKCRGLNHPGIRKIPKGTICFRLIQPAIGKGYFYAFYCPDCITDIFIEFEKELKKNGLYNNAMIKSILM
jgi:hypothetical protein